MEAFVYTWVNEENGLEYIGYHKGDEDDGYISSSKNDQFWYDYDKGLLERHILYRGTMEECVEKESNYLKTRGLDNLYNRNINGKIQMTDDVRKKISDALSGRAQSESHILARSEALKGREGGFKGKSHSASTIQKMKTVIRSDEHKKAISIALKGREGTFKGKSHSKQICPHCNKEIAVNMYNRWHGDNCKEKSNE
jgi:hypothetical protein